MKRSLHLSAAQTAMLGGIGGLIVTIGFLLPGVFYTRYECSHWPARTLLLVPLFLIGATILVLAQKRLKRGIEDGRWPPAEVEALRTNLNSRLWQAAAAVCLIAWFISLAESGKYRALLQAAVPLLFTITSLQNAVRRPKGSEPRLGLDWRGRPPLRSEHWGNR